MAQQFAEANKRLFENKFVDKKSGRVIKANPLKVQAGKIRGRGKNATRNLRPKRKK